MGTSYEDERLAEIEGQVRSLLRLAREDAEDALWRDPKRMAEIAFGGDGMFLTMPGVDGPNEHGALPLVVHVRDMITNDPQPHLAFDPVKILVDAYGDSDEALEAIGRAIGTLEAGIQRLRAEAARIRGAQ